MKISSYNTLDYLNSKDDVKAYLKEVQKLANEANLPELVIEAIGEIARSKGMSKIAKETQLNRENLYKSLSKKGNPSFSSIFKIIHSLGFELNITESTSPKISNLEFATN